MRVLVACAALLLLGSCHGLELRVYVTAGCTDTVWFIQNQLIQVYREFEEFLDVTFVPWGRTVRAADGSLTCQFGAADCWANRVQRCALNLLPTAAARHHYMSCEYASNTDRPAFLQGSYICAHAAGVHLPSLDYCVSSFAGEPLDAAAEAQTQVPMQVINFVPALVLGNAEPNAAASMSALIGLRAAVCAALLADPSSGLTSC